MTITDICRKIAGNADVFMVRGLRGSSPAYLVSEAMASGVPLVLVVTRDMDSAREFHKELCFFAGSDDSVLLFPSWEIMPGDQASPHPDITGARLGTLVSLRNRLCRAVVMPVAAMLQRVMARNDLGKASCYLLCGEEVERDELLEALVSLGYISAQLVEDRGTFAVRGGILDIFPPDLDNPVRIEFFGDTVESIRYFDPLTQRSRESIEELLLLPSREVVIHPDSLETAVPFVKEVFDGLEIPADVRRQYMEDLKNSFYPQGIEFLQPVFHTMETIFDYSGNAPVLLIDHDSIHQSVDEFARELEASSRQAQAKQLPFAPLEQLFMDRTEFEKALSGRPLLKTEYLAVGVATGEAPVPCEANDDLKLVLSKESSHALRPFAATVTEWFDIGHRVILVCHQQAQAERMQELLTPYGTRCEIAKGDFRSVRNSAPRQVVSIMAGDISKGFRLPYEHLVVVAEEELFGRRQRKRGASELRKKQILTSLAEMKPGDMMVHIDHGMGIYRGLQHIAVGTTEADFLLLEYAGGDKLYLPIDRLALVQPYTGPEGSEPSPDRLGGSGWEKTKGKARKAVEELAGELLEIYARRAMSTGHSFSPPDEMYREFEASFAWEETPDQLAAIEEVLTDLQSDRPMDRLVCGDVGYGKTEVALRAAFKAALDGKQVALLVPTTILAQQHFETFSERLKGYPVTVEAISRFRTPKEQKDILERLRLGRTDIIIGTHRLLQKDVTFKDLGLVIIDEEQRFGVKDKERLKQYRAMVDVMALSATPIPRTLSLSIMGVRDLSIIDTAPVDRLSVKTYVSRFSEELVKDAVTRELRRGGQVFFVHNRVQSILQRAEQISSICPEARIAVAHGQMDEHELERIMLAFMHGETNLLVCTTIIESGLDIPNANTMIIDRADTFGLSQLYQLRGRVGRSRQRGYAYLLIPGEGAITGDARERLRILQDISELGAGFRIATHDMEIRGAGDLLGGRQSGTVADVGFELYTQMLEETIHRLKGEGVCERIEPELNLKVPAFIPENHVPAVNQRLILYKRLTQADSADDVTDIRGEMEDRFGSSPQSVLYLFEVMTLRILMKKLLVTKADYDGRNVLLSFHGSTPVSPEKIISLVKSDPKRIQFTPDCRLTALPSSNGFEGVLSTVRNLLNRLL